MSNRCLTECRPLDPERRQPAKGRGAAGNDDLEWIPNISIEGHIDDVVPQADPIVPGPLSTEQVRRRYDDMAGNWRLLGISDALLLINRLRRKHFSSARGDALDVGCGTGENFEYLKRAATLTALDVSSEMIEEARRRRRQLGADIRLLVGDAQELPFPEARFDTVISAFSSCTFPDYAAAFREMVRVTKPGGRVLLLEHGRSSVGWIARRQDRNIDRVYERSACRNNRDVAADLAEAGLEPATHVVSHLGMMNRITLEVSPTP